MSWDVDGNGQFDALTDGRLALLYLLGFRGQALIENSLATDATRTTLEEILAYLDQIRDQFDIDGNGTFDGLTDGILNMRHLFGFGDDALIRNAIGAGATRGSAAGVSAYLDAIANGTTEAPSLFTTVDPSTVPENPGADDPSVVRQDFVAVDFTPLESDSGSESQAVELNLFEDASFNVIFEEVKSSSDDASLVRVGTVEGFPDSDVILVNSKTDDAMIGNIRIGDEFYQVRFVDDGVHAVRQIDQTKFVDEPPDVELDLDLDDPVAIPDSSFLTAGDSVNGDGEISSVISVAATADGEGSSLVDDGSIIDVMVVYTPAALEAAGGTTGMNLLIAAAEEETNQGYENSGVIQRIRIVHSEEVPYSETSTDAFKNALEALTNAEDGLENVHALRNTYSADMVSIWIDDGEYCGLGWVMGSPSYEFASRGFSAVNQACATGYYSFAHEMGHNQGVTHNIENTQNPPNFPYAYGYRDPEREFRTIMAYNGDGSRVPRLNYWSNPDLTYNGKPLGIAGEADNRLALNDTRLFAANWRHSNDNFANAKEISGSEITSTALNVNATEETSEPDHAGNAGGKSLWWSWTAPSSGDVTITTAGSDFDSILGVYTGNSVFDLTPIASNITSSVTFDAVTGIDYKIAVDGLNGASGEIIMNLTQDVFINNPPVATNDATTVGFQTSAIIAVLANDTDENSDVLSISGFSSVSSQGGAIALDGDGLRYTPANIFSGNDSFRYSISDGNGGTDSAIVNVTVSSAPNQPPISNDDGATTDEILPVTIAVLDNDSDPEGTTLSIAGITAPNNGTVSISSDELIYTPDVNFAGTDSFAYTISDGELTDSAMVTVTVNPVNDPPVAIDDSQITREDTEVTIAVLDNDSDPEGDTLSIADITAPNNGTVSVSSDEVIYTPNPDFFGTDSFTYSISDGSLDGTDTATVTVTVESVNDAPIAVDDLETTTEGMLATIAVLDNDSDPDGDTLSITVGTPGNGSAVVNGDRVVYRPDLNFSGTDSFTYTLGDGQGGTDTATVTAIVTLEANDPPVAFPDRVTITADGSTNIPVLLNDSDPDGDRLDITGVTNPSNGSASIRGEEIIYTPDAGATADSFTYSIVDSRGATATAEVTVEIVDQIIPTDGNDLILGSNLLDSQTGSREELNGGNGNDSIIGGRGADILSGGPGADEFVYSSLADSGADPDATTEGGDDILDFNPAEGDSIRLNFDVASGTPVTDGDVEINLQFIDVGVVAIGLSTGNTPPEFLPEQFVLQLSGLEPTTTEQDIRDALKFGAYGDELILGNDLLNSQTGSREELNGGNGNDTIIGGRGADILSGGAGADEFVYSSLADSGADPDATTEGSDNILDFNPAEGDIIRMNFDVASGTPVTDGDVEINLQFIDFGVVTIGLSTGNTPPEFLPEQFVLQLSSLDPTTTSQDIRDALRFGA